MKRSILPDSLECKIEEKLLDFFDTSEDGSQRMVKVTVNDKKQLELSAFKQTSEGSAVWKDNFNEYVTKSVESDKPCFIFYRLDEKNKATGQFMWLFISWSPDCVSNKLRTIYALCKSTLIHKFSGGQIKDNIFASEMQELTLESYLEFINEPKPLSEADKKLIFLDENENEARVEHKSNFKILPGLNLPVDPLVLKQLELFKQEKCNYMQLIIDQKTETIKLDKTFDKLDVNLLAKEIPQDKGRFHLYRFAHLYEDLPYKSLIFIYSMPGFICTVKERMMYSSCKSELISYLKSQHICPIKTLETSEPSEITKEYLIEEIHPKKYVIFKKEGLTDTSSLSSQSKGLTRRVTFHEDTKADDSWINAEIRKEREFKKKAPLKPAEKAGETAAPLVEESYMDSLTNSILHNNLFYVLLFGLIFLSISIFSIRLLRNVVNLF